MAWRAAISSGSPAPRTLTLPVLASFGPPEAPPSFSFALHAPPIKRTIESSDSTLNRRIETPLLVVQPLFLPKPVRGVQPNPAGTPRRRMTVAYQTALSF